MYGNIIPHVLGTLLVPDFRLAKQFLRKNQAQSLRLIMSPKLIVLGIYVNICGGISP
jgi:hypothetical protein